MLFKDELKIRGLSNVGHARQESMLYDRPLAKVSMPSAFSNRISIQWLLLPVFLVAITQGGWSQRAKPPKNWHLLHSETDYVQGLGVERAYELLKDRQAQPVIVAVIDTGVDTDHEDLQGAIWVNPNEIASNGIDDDKNGYIDDIHGWNFLGGKTGNVNNDTYEVTREYARLRSEFEAVDTNTISKKRTSKYNRYVALKERWENLKLENEQQLKWVGQFLDNFKFSQDTLHAYLGNSITEQALQQLQSQNPNVVFAKSFYRQMLLDESGDSIEDQIENLKEAYEAYQVAVDYSIDPDFDPRSMVGDQYSNPIERYYGNSQVKPMPGPFMNHGTHVAGIIAANRNNALGIDGIAGQAKIMVIRAVPNGDERDKDIANAIYYAVDNGAKVINMSCGKTESPQKFAVDKAVQYAAQKGVLIVHAAGNDGTDNDVVSNYPSAAYKNKKVAKNWIEVGASSWQANPNLIGTFSNYGQKTVDVFAPGVAIYSTITANRYKLQDGTSMAAPAVTGVAALLMSYFPNLTALQVKKIILQSASRFNGLVVKQPGTGEGVLFSQLSKTGAVVNAYQAVQMALSFSNR